MTDETHKRPYSWSEANDAASFRACGSGRRVTRTPAADEHTASRTRFRDRLMLAGQAMAAT